MLFKMIFFIAIFTILSLFIGFATISSVIDSSPTDDRDGHENLYISKSGQLSTSSTHDHGDSRLDQLRPNPDRGSIRKKAIEAAMKQTKQFLNREGRLQRLRDVEKEAYLQKIEDEEELKRQKEVELAAEQAELLYYMYYEDSIDEKSTVIGMAYGTDLITFQRFVGSLRQTGFGGVIILGVEGPSPEVLAYLSDQRVIVKSLETTACTFNTAKKNEKCYQPYPHIKREWAHFPLARDWLSACASCTGPVVFASADDTYFQKNPFGKGMPVVKRLHLFEQHPSMDVAQTSASVLLKACLDIDLAARMDEEDDLDLFPMGGILSASTALGTRDDIIDYLGSVYSIFRQWMQKPECHFSHSNSDAGMAAVNFLRIKDRLPYRTRIMIHRTGIVNNAEFEGTNALDAHVHLWKFRGLTEEEALVVPFEGGQGANWIDIDYMVTDKDGHFIDVFLQKSAIIYGYHSFGPFFLARLDEQMGIKSESETSAKVTLTTTQQVNIDNAESNNSLVKPVPAIGANDNYLLDGKQIKVQSNNTEPERKQKQEKRAEVPDNKKKVIEGMYYGDQVENKIENSPGEEAGKLKVSPDNPLVPVQETREKEAESVATNKNDDADDATAEEISSQAVMAAPVLVDKKFEISENRV